MGLQKIVVLCVGLAVVGVGVWYVTSNGSETASTNTEEESVPTAAENAPLDDSFRGVGSLQDLLTRGDSFMCTYRVGDENGTMEGTSYIDGQNERYRMDGTGNWDGSTGQFGAIVDATTMYWWADTPEGTMGMIMPVSETDTTVSAESEVAANQPITPDQDVQYDCAPWSVDASVFTPPADIEFTDMAAMMGDMIQGMPEGFEMPEGFAVPQ